MQYLSLLCWYTNIVLAHKYGNIGFKYISLKLKQHCCDYDWVVLCLIIGTNLPLGDIIIVQMSWCVLMQAEMSVASLDSMTYGTIFL